MTNSIRLETRPIPTVEVPTPAPLLPTALYMERMANACMRAKNVGLDIFAVYGDREHAANLEYLTGFDPRFEEALLLLAADGRAKLLVGNECMGYTPDPALGIETELFQEFSLLGQPRGGSRPFQTILRDFGIQRDVRVGAVGWKYFDGDLIASTALDVPAYLADLLRDLCRPSEVRNATAIFMDAQDGLRTINEPEQIARFEYAASVTAAGVLDVFANLEIGVPEWQLERHLDSRGLPLSCHRMINTGEKVRRGLSSASTNRVGAGDPFVVAFGVAGALTCRAGCAASGPSELSTALRDFYPGFAANYFAMVAAWYESVRVGAAGRDVFRAVEAVRDARLYSLAVNPGHQLHLDEWLNSPFSADETTVLKSGMALQMDIIPVSHGPFCYANAEDGIVLADEDLRASIATSMPALWQRTQRRRNVVREQYGIVLDESVLPMSDLTAWLAPYVMNPSQAFVKG